MSVFACREQLLHIERFVMIIFPSLLFGVLAVLATLIGRRPFALSSWVLALLSMLGAMYFHMSDALRISL